jgi:ubiquinone/menaquinone biosynthesis C-methylase UbiE
MKLNRLEFLMMNNLVRAWSQRALEAPRLIGPPGTLRGQRVLEVGCGRGVGVEILLALGATHVTGLDLDPDMITLAQHRLSHHANHALVAVGDVEAMQFPDNAFDAVVEFGILHHVPHWQQALREIARVLNPGGAFYFEDLLRGLISSPPMRALFAHPQATQFTATQFCGALAAAGLRIERLRLYGNFGLIGKACNQRLNLNP